MEQLNLSSLPAAEFDPELLESGAQTTARTGDRDSYGLCGTHGARQGGASKVLSPPETAVTPSAPSLPEHFPRAIDRPKEPGVLHRQQGDTGSPLPVRQGREEMQPHRTEAGVGHGGRARALGTSRSLSRLGGVRNEFPGTESARAGAERSPRCPERVCVSLTRSHAGCAERDVCLGEPPLVSCTPRVVAGGRRTWGLGAGPQKIPGRADFGSRQTLEQARVACADRSPSSKDGTHFPPLPDDLRLLPPLPQPHHTICGRRSGPRGILTMRRKVGFKIHCRHGTQIKPGPLTARGSGTDGKRASWPSGWAECLLKLRDTRTAQRCPTS